jgi:hypothetical protein
MAQAPNENAPRQSTGDVLMVRPAAFALNEVTRPTNAFQSAEPVADTDVVARAAVAEFNAVVATLVARGIDVHLFEGRTSTTLPDEIFPNNWLSTHDDGTVVLYPLFAWNRRGERRRDIVDELQQKVGGFRIERVVDLAVLEDRGHFLEGTGSLVLDRRGSTAFACRSPRTHAEALHVFTHRLGFQPVLFDAVDGNGHSIYHTNVMMALGESFAVACLDAIPEVKERYRVLRRLEAGGREVIEISPAQMRAFAGNILELEGRDGKLIVMSTGAARSLEPHQLAAIGAYGEIVAVNVGTIERYGGGGVRCILAEIFLPRK